MNGYDVMLLVVRYAASNMCGAVQPIVDVYKQLRRCKQGSRGFTRFCKTMKRSNCITTASRCYRRIDVQLVGFVRTCKLRRNVSTRLLNNRSHGSRYRFTENISLMFDFSCFPFLNHLHNVSNCNAYLPNRWENNELF